MFSGFPPSQNKPQGTGAGEGGAHQDSAALESVVNIV